MELRLKLWPTNQPTDRVMETLHFERALVEKISADMDQIIN